MLTTIIILSVITVPLTVFICTIESAWRRKNDLNQKVSTDPPVIYFKNVGVLLVYICAAAVLPVLKVTLFCILHIVSQKRRHSPLECK